MKLWRLFTYYVYFTGVSLMQSVRYFSFLSFLFYFLYIYFRWSIQLWWLLKASGQRGDIGNSASKLSKSAKAPLILMIHRPMGVFLSSAILFFSFFYSLRQSSFLPLSLYLFFSFLFLLFLRLSPLRPRSIPFVLFSLSLLFRSVPVAPFVAFRSYAAHAE